MVIRGREQAAGGNRISAELYKLNHTILLWIKTILKTLVFTKADKKQL